MAVKSGFTLERLAQADQGWVRNFMVDEWGSDRMVVHGDLFYPHEMDGFVLRKGAETAGVVTFQIEGDDCEVVTINSVMAGQGVGAMLMDAVVGEARAAGCARVWLMTTNDNLPALGFYQKYGMRLVAVYPGAVDESRKRKPEIPALGFNNIPLRDELELELRLD